MSVTTDRILREGYSVTYIPAVPIDLIGTRHVRWLDGLPVVYQINARMADEYVGQYDCPALYVGRTEDLAGRIAAHARDKRWWDAVCCVDVDVCPSLEVSIAHEQARIYAEVPLFNTQFNRRQPKTYLDEWFVDYFARYRGVDWSLQDIGVMSAAMTDGILNWDGMEIDEANGVVSDDPFEYDAQLKAGAVA